MNTEIIEAFAKEIKDRFEYQTKKGMRSAYDVARLKYFMVAKVAKRFDPLFDIFAFEKACGFKDVE